MGLSSAVVVCLRRTLRCPHAKPITSRELNHWLCCGEMMAAGMQRTIDAAERRDLFSAVPRLRAGDDLHRDTDDPADQDQPGPGDVRLGAQDDDADGEERSQRREERADGSSGIRPRRSADRPRRGRQAAACRCRDRSRSRRSASSGAGSPARSARRRSSRHGRRRTARTRPRPSQGRGVPALGRFPDAKTHGRTLPVAEQRA